MKKAIPRLLFAILTLVLGLHAHCALAASPAIVLNQDLSDAYSLTNFKGDLYFIGEDAAHGKQLWKSDGTPAGTVMTDLIPYNDKAFIGSLGVYGGDLYFCAIDHDTGNPNLWRSDGTKTGTVRLKTLTLVDVKTPWVTPFNGAFYFTAYSEATGYELWRSDGTPSGTLLIKDINPSTSNNAFNPPSPDNLTVCNGQLYFTADDGTSGNELWVTDGSIANTRMVEDICPGSVGSIPRYLMNVNGKLLFFANDGIHGAELWRCDAPNAGAYMVKDINPGAPGVLGHSSYVVINGIAFFCANDETHGGELWKSDGTMAGTVMVKDFNSSYLNVHIHELANLNGNLIFALPRTRYGGEELWKTDGTDAGTVLIKKINSIGYSITSFPGFSLMVNGALFFAAAGDGVNGVELWKTDGTANGTNLFADILPEDFSYPGNLTEINGSLYFTGHADSAGSFALMRLGEKVPVELSGFAAE